MTATVKRQIPHACAITKRKERKEETHANMMYEQV